MGEGLWLFRPEYGRKVVVADGSLGGESLPDGEVKGAEGSQGV